MKKCKLRKPHSEEEILKKLPDNLRLISFERIRDQIEYAPVAVKKDFESKLYTEDDEIIVFRGELPYQWTWSIHDDISNYRVELLFFPKENNIYAEEILYLDKHESLANLILDILV